MSQDLTPNEIIDALGGTSATARLCNVKDPSVSEWRVSGIPPARLMFLKLARPDVFGGNAPDTYGTAQSSARRATDPEPSPGHAGRQPPSRSNVMAAEVAQPPALCRTTDPKPSPGHGGRQLPKVPT